MAQAPALPRGFELPLEPRLPRVGSVDQVAVEERAATLPVTLVMLEAVRDVHAETGKKVGVKAAGGIRHAKEAVQYLVLVNETLGPEWLTPDLYRLGASSLLNDVLMQIRKEKTGIYRSPDEFTLD